MTTPSPHDLEALLSNAAWARALARSLTRDAHRADDLVQRAWVAALEHPPHEPASPRGWIASVLRNFARQDARAEGRRAHHERASARSESVEPGRLDESAAAQRELLDAVMALAEPYRTAIWARYYEGLPPREIARRDGLALTTVKARLARGLAELRNKLDKNHGGDRSAWMAALLPLAGARPSIPILGVLMMDAKLKIAAALVAAAGLALVFARVRAPELPHPEPFAERPEPALELSAPDEVVASLAPPDAPASARAAFEAHEAPAAPPAAPEPRTVRGRVLDLDLGPVGGLEVFARSGPRDDGEGKPTLVTSAPDGSFSTPAGAGRLELAARGRDWVTVFAASNAWGDDDGDYSIFVAPRCELAGRVVDPEHEPIAGASVRFLVDASLRREVGAPLDTSMPSDWQVQSDEGGRFALENAPLVKGSATAEAIGYEPAAIDAPGMPSWNLELVLRPLEVRHLIVRGRVIDERGQPVEGANVALGPTTELTSRDGAFAFDVDDMRDLGEAENVDGKWVPRFRPDALFAVKPGKLPARLELPPVAELRRRDHAEEFTLVLAGEPLEIHGRVLEADGGAVANAIVRLSDETPFGMIYQKVGGEGIGVATSAEKLLRGSAWSGEVRTDDDGSFTLGGLLEREYHAVVLDPRTLRRATSEAVRAGSRSVEIRLPDRTGCVRVAGRVVGLDGTPISGASVGLGAVIEDRLAPMYAAQVDTDPDGRFEFESVVSTELVFSVTHPSTFFVFGWKPAPGDTLDQLELRVARKGHVQVDLGDNPGLADEFAVVDARGEAVQLVMSRGNMMWLPERAEIVQGKSEPVACAENGATVVLYKAGQEVARLPLRLVMGEITVVRP